LFFGRHLYTIYAIEQVSHRSSRTELLIAHQSSRTAHRVIRYLLRFWQATNSLFESLAVT